MRLLLLSLFLFVFFFDTTAQTTDGLVVYYSADLQNGNIFSDDTGGGSNGTLINSNPNAGIPNYTCGVQNTAIQLDGNQQHILLLGIINNYFENDDFTLSFFMYPTSNNGTQTIFSKREACTDDNAFAIRYSPGANAITAELSESSAKKSVLSATLDFTKCWFHITLVREGATSRLYLNGILQDTETAISRINLTSSGVIGIAEGACVGVTDNPYGGLLDEIRLYDRALNPNEVLGLYTPLTPNSIITPDTTVFLGNTVQIVSGNTCAQIFDWTPATNLSQDSIPEPLISPDQTLTYELSFIDTVLGCIAYDSIRITVIDPDDLDCTKVFLPNAFTPNADGRNDTYGISNPYAVTDLVSFEIFDRWGGRVFMATDPMDRWDGSFKGQPMNPGVLLYKLTFMCNGEEFVNVGSVSIIR